TLHEDAGLWPPRFGTFVLIPLRFSEEGRPFLQEQRVRGGLQSFLPKCERVEGENMAWLCRLKQPCSISAPLWRPSVETARSLASGPCTWLYKALSDARIGLFLETVLSSLSVLAAMRPGLPVNSSVTSVGNDLLEAVQQAKAIRQGDKGLPTAWGDKGSSIIGGQGLVQTASGCVRARPKSADDSQTKVQGFVLSNTFTHELLRQKTGLLDENALCPP
ncbi:DNA polymerase, partial [Dissostichus eleginoides]